MEETELRKRFPRAHAYLTARKRELLRRRQAREWFTFSAPRNLDVHRRAQLMVPLLANAPSYCPLPKNMASYCPMASGGFTFSISPDQRLSPQYVLGLLNSKLLFWVLKKISNVFRGGWITCTKQYVGKLPIRTIQWTDGGEQSHHDRMVALVDRMIRLQTRVDAVRSAHEQTVLKRQVEAADAEIDRLVYELYGLSKEEIKIVEEATPK